MYIVVGSATTAERLRRAAEKASGLPAYVVRTPAPIRKGGCSYSVKLDSRALGTVKKLMCEYGFPAKNIYSEKIENGERVYRAVS